MKRTVFSWSKEQLEQPEETMAFLEKSKVTAIFQHVTKGDRTEIIAAFLKTAQDKDVYWLTGDPQWALDKMPLLEIIARANTYSDQLKGIVIDVEPYLLKDFGPEIMTRFVANMKEAYQAANLEVILCLPYFFDQIGFRKELAELVKDASDAVAIMNYYRGKETEHIQTEAQLALTYGKPIYTIYELQPPGMHGLKPENTYYHLGIDAALTQFKQLKSKYPNQEVQVAFHEYDFYKRLFERRDKN